MMTRARLTRSLLVGVAAILIVFTARADVPRLRQHGDGLPAVPRHLGPRQSVRGVLWQGREGHSEDVDEIVARDLAAGPPRGPVEMRGLEGEGAEEGEERPANRIANPAALAVERWPMVPGTEYQREAPLSNAVLLSTNWLGTRLSESNALPPDSHGSVGPTQVFVASNGRFKVFDKNGVLSTFNVSDSSFFTSVRGGAGVSDPRVRYDRLSGRWFVSEITTTNTSNRILLAVSSGSEITSTSSFTFFEFQQDAVGPTPNVDTGRAADYDTLAVDAHALYIGVNMFGSGYTGTTGFVVNKANLLAGTLTVTAFRGLSASSGAGVFTPQGVDNDDPDATEGYFIGVDNATFSKLQIRRVSNPGGTPSISGNIPLTVPTTTFPISQVAQDSTRPLDALDDRLYSAMIKRNKITGVSSLWTAHTIAVSTTGVGLSSGTSRRNGSRWYQIDNLTTTPTLTQAGTVFDSAASSPLGYWMPTVAANGQGHMALGASIAGTASFASIYITGRLASDTLGLTQAGTTYPGAAAYNAQTSPSSQRWGDYSQVAVDPTDDQTMWTFQEYCDATNSWAVRVIQMLAPPPATIASASPATIRQGVGSTDVTITGASSGGSGFFDPGTAFTSRLRAVATGGLTVNSVTFVDATTVTLNVSTVGATVGSHGVTVTNPDGQQASHSSLLTVTQPATLSVAPRSVGLGATITATVGSGPGRADDFVGLFETSAGDTSPLVTQFLNGQQTQPSIGLTSAALTFGMPTVAGTYEVRMFSSNPLVLLVRSERLTVSCPTAAPVAGWICTNSSWLPPTHPLAQAALSGSRGATAGTSSTSSGSSDSSSSSSSSGGSSGSSSTASNCTGTAPVSDWVCVNSGWVPPDHPLALQAGSGSSSGGSSSSSGGSSGNSGGSSSGGSSSGGSSGGSGSSSCPGTAPVSNWVCVNGGWVPPDHPLALGGGSSSGGSGGSSGGSGTSSGGTGSSPSTGCTTPDPFIGIPGMSGVCINGGWVPANYQGG